MGAEPRDVPTIYKVAAERLNQIENLKIRYRVAYQKVADLPSHTAQKISLSTDPREVEFAMDGERRKQILTSLKDGPRQPGDMKTTTTIFNGSRSIKYYEDGIAEITAGKVDHCDDSDIYVSQVIGIPVTDPQRASYDNDWFYPHCLRPAIGARPKYRLADQTEAIDGASCVVVEAPGYDKLWLDPRLGYVARRREEYYGPETPILVNADSAAEFTEAFEGIWLPRHWERTLFAEPSNPPEYHNKPYLVITIDVLDLAVNQVTDADFAASLKSGRYVHDNTNRRIYQVPGNELDVLRDLAAAGERYVVEIVPEPRGDSSGGRVWRICMVAGSLVALGAVWFLITWRKRRPGST